MTATRPRANRIRFIARNTDGSIYGIYECAGDRYNFKYWYGAVRDHSAGCTVEIQGAFA